MLKPHEALRLRASVTMQETAVVPTGSDAPETTLHDVVNGCAPPAVVGAANVTTAVADADVWDTSAGQLIVGAPGVGVGGVGPDPQADAPPRAASSAQRTPHVRYPRIFRR